MKYYSDKILQKTYLDKIFENCQTLSDDYDFYVICSHPKESGILHLPEDNKPKVVFDLGDEWHRVPFYYNRNDIVLILREYSPLDLQNHKKIKPIPPIFNYGNWSGITKNIDQKELLVFSSMGLWPSRSKLKDILSRYENSDKFSIHWNEQFNSGYDYSEYMKNLTNSLISISPQGYITTETARTWEIIQAKTIPICKRQIPYWYYHGMRLFQYDDESQIPDLINHIISLDPEEQQSIVDLNKKIFDENVSPKAIASWIETKLKDMS